MRAGCGGSTASSPPEAVKDFQEIARAYDMIVAGKNRPPKTVDELREILLELHTYHTVGDPAEALRSSRDGEQYVIVMGVNFGAVVSGDILAYEKKGKEGKRFVLRLSRNVDEVTDEEFARSTFANQHQPEGK